MKRNGEITAKRMFHNKNIGGDFSTSLEMTKKSESF
jgi:hypothetical protein